ncbi:MAG: nucleotide exchange factor GrpE [Bacilli bacterium]|nr:nucleotide exchange factor GrpE [Bacilli bacterium]MBQ6497998.1 nucleotide exchange factor GrpE [Bacilli bacterium]
MGKKKQDEKFEFVEDNKDLEQDTKLNEEMLKLEEEIRTLTEENKTLNEKVKLAQADLINYRKRKDEETANTLKYANGDIIKDLLNVSDNLERALKNKDVSDELKKYLSGFEMIYENLKTILSNYGVSEINRVGEVFDPNLEQALMTECVEDKDDDIVLEVLLKGYKLKDRVIRPASVKINQK